MRFFLTCIIILSYLAKACHCNDSELITIKDYMTELIEKLRDLVYDKDEPVKFKI